MNSHIRDTCSKLKNVDYMPTPVTKQHLSRGGIHINDQGQQKLTAAMAEVFNNHTVTSQSFHTNHHNKDISNVNTEVINDQVGEIRVLSWDINGLGNKMADPDLLAFIREYDIIFLTETMKSNDYTLLLPGYQFHHVSRKFKHKNASRASGGIRILLANKFEKHTRIDSTYDHLVWLTITTEYYQKNIKIRCAYIPSESSTYVSVRNGYFTMLVEEVARYTESHRIISCGDFHCRTGRASD